MTARPKPMPCAKAWRPWKSIAPGSIPLREPLFARPVLGAHRPGPALDGRQREAAELNLTAVRLCGQNISSPRIFWCCPADTLPRAGQGRVHALKPAPASSP